VHSKKRNNCSAV